jgi:hypothetical protein
VKRKVVPRSPFRDRALTLARLYSCAPHGVWPALHTTGRAHLQQLPRAGESRTSVRGKAGRCGGARGGARLQELLHVRRERRAAAQDERHAAAQARLDLGEDQPVEEGRRLRGRPGGLRLRARPS